MELIPLERFLQHRDGKVCGVQVPGDKSAPVTKKNLDKILRDNSDFSAPKLHTKTHSLPLQSSPPPLYSL